MKRRALLPVTSLLVALLPLTVTVHAAGIGPTRIGRANVTGVAVLAHSERSFLALPAHVSQIPRLRADVPRLMSGGNDCAVHGTLSEHWWGWNFRINSCLVVDLVNRSVPVPTISDLIAKQCLQCTGFAAPIVRAVSSQRSWALGTNRVCGDRGIVINGMWTSRSIWITAVCGSVRASG